MHANYKPFLLAMAATETLTVVRQCNQDAFTRLFGNLARTCAIEDAQLEELSNMFVANSTLKKPIMSSWPETAMTIWVFPQTEHAWNAIQRFLLKTLRPRVYEASETRPAQKELFMVVPLKPLMTTPEKFDKWIEKFTELIGMSAGCVCFEEYFGAQMLSSMMRVDNGKKIASNFPCQYHKDFSMLYVRLSEQQSTDSRVRKITGKDFNQTNFVQMFLQNQRLTETVNSINFNLETVIKDAEKWRKICASVAETLKGAHEISEDAQKEICKVIMQDLFKTPVVETGMQRAPQDAVQALEVVGSRLPPSTSIDTSWNRYSVSRYPVMLVDQESIAWTIPRPVTE